MKITKIISLQSTETNHESWFGNALTYFLDYDWTVYMVLKSTTTEIKVSITSSQLEFLNLSILVNLHRSNMRFRWAYIVQSETIVLQWEVELISLTKYFLGKMYEAEKSIYTNRGQHLFFKSTTYLWCKAHVWYEIPQDSFNTKLLRK